MRCQGIEPRALTWKASILPLKKEKLIYQFFTTLPPGLEPFRLLIEKVYPIEPWGQNDKY